MDWLSSSNFMDAAKILVVTEIPLLEVEHGGFQKCFKEFYEHWQNYISDGRQFCRKLCLWAS
jgi:hypothetical protein